MSNSTSKSTSYLQYVQDKSIKDPLFQQSLKTFHSVYYEVVKMELHKRGEAFKALEPVFLQAGLDRISNRMDMAEFGIPAFVRILHEYRDFLSGEQITSIEKTLIGFRYWLDEPGDINACYFTENHQVLYHSAEYLVGSLFPRELFPSNQKSGEWHRQHGLTMLDQWMDWRINFGFSEWCTNYYAEDMLALLGVYRYADNTKIKEKAEKIIRILLVEMALNTFEGNWSGCQGRTYPHYLGDHRNESISPICKLLWDKGSYEGPIADCAIMLATYNFDCPSDIIAIAQNSNSEIINKERMSLNTEDTPYYGVNPSDFNDIMFYWGNQTYSAKCVVENSRKVLIQNNWMNERFNAYAEKYKLYEAAQVACDYDPDFTALTQVDLYTYKTQDYVMTTAQDYRKGKAAYQHQPWGVYMGDNAKVFTNHPGSQDFEDRPNQIAGNWYLPKAVQYRNTSVVIYRIPADCTRMLETHAYFPQSEFDEILIQNGWLFGKHSDAYIAMYSLMPAQFVEPDARLYTAIYGACAKEYITEMKPFFYHANGHANVWITEMGSKTQNGSFCQFVSQFTCNSLVSGDTFRIEYHSPANGLMTVGWDEPLTVNNEAIQIHDYKRFDNLFFQEEFVHKG